MASEPVVRQVFIARTRSCQRRHGVRAQALRHPQAGGARHPLRRASRAATSFTSAAFVQDDHLQRHADARAGGAVLSRPRRPGDGERAGAGAFAFQHQHVSRAGTARIRTATWRTTAKSTPCAATSTGCTPARRCSSPTCSATTSRKLLPVINEDGSDSAMFDNCAGVSRARAAARCRMP